VTAAPRASVNRSDAKSPTMVTLTIGNDIGTTSKGLRQNKSFI
jgi:hypothetical protein